MALRWDRVDLDYGVLKVLATVGRVDGQLVITPQDSAVAANGAGLPAVVARLHKQQGGPGG